MSNETQAPDPRAIAEQIGIKVADRPTYKVPLKLLRSSAGRQPRNGSAPNVDDLVPSIAEHGLLHPIWVRSLPLEPPDPELGAMLFETLIGERRSIAVHRLGWETIDAEIHDELSELDVFLIQNAENDRREGLSPIEQADAVRRLMAPKAEGGFGVHDTAEVAARLGISIPVVYQRLALAEATPEVRSALSKKRIYLGAAVALASIKDPDRQVEALSQVIAEEGEELRHVRSVQALVQDRFHLRLAGAPFDTTLADLTPAGACGPCPKRSGAPPQRLLFDDGVDAGDRCTDATCFGEKKNAWRLREIARARAENLVVIEGKEGAALYPAGKLLLARAPAYLDLDEQPTGGGGQSYRQIVRVGDVVKVAAIAIDRDERVHYLADRAKLLAALEAAGFTAPDTSSGEVREPNETKTAKAGTDAATPPAASKPSEEFALLQQAEEAAGYEVLGQIAQKGAKWKASASFYRMVLRSLVVLAPRRLEFVVERRGLKNNPTAKSQNDADLLLAEIERQDEDGARGLLAELVASLDGLHPQEPADHHALVVGARFFKIDLAGAVKTNLKAVKSEKRKKDRPARTPPAPRVEEPKPGTCSACGCTDDHACTSPNGDPCVWDKNKTLCSICGDIEIRLREHLEEGLRAPTRDELVQFIENQIAPEFPSAAEHKAAPKTFQERVERCIADAVRRKRIVEEDGRFRLVGGPRVIEKPATAGATPDATPPLRTRLVRLMRQHGGKIVRRVLLDAMKTTPPTEILREIAQMKVDRLLEEGANVTDPITLVAPTYEDVLEDLEAARPVVVKARYAEVFRARAEGLSLPELRHAIAVRLSGDVGGQAAVRPRKPTK